MIPRRELVLLRHGKSDWSVPASDLERPLTSRGVRQATQAGQWIGEHLVVDLALVSAARRARRTWDLASAELPSQPSGGTAERLYTFDGRDVLEGGPRAAAMASARWCSWPQPGLRGGGRAT